MDATHWWWLRRSFIHSFIMFEGGGTTRGASHGLKVRESDSYSKGCEFESRAVRNCQRGEWMYSTLSTFKTMTKVPLSKAPNPQLLPGRQRINSCPLLRVCVHCCVCVHCYVCTLDGLNAEHEFRVWVTILGRVSRQIHFFFSIKSCLGHPFGLASSGPDKNVSTICFWRNIVVSCNSTHSISCSSGAAISIYCTAPHTFTSVRRYFEECG